MATTLPFPTINVVPAGFRWSADAAEKARTKGAFLRVGGPQVTRRYLSGVKRSWTSAKPEENQTIFHTGYRITGTPDAIRTALQYAGVPHDQIEDVIATAITRDNYETTKAQEVADELALHAQAKIDKPAVEGYDFNQILWFSQNIKSAVISTKTGEQKGAVTTPGRGGAGDTLFDKIRKLGQGKVLDVSNMDINTGKGVRSIPAPKTYKSGKYGTDRVPIISNDLNKYIRAIQLAYGPEGPQQYALDIGVVQEALTRMGGPAGQMGGPVAQIGGPVAQMGGLTAQMGALGTAQNSPSPRRLGATIAQPGTTIAQPGATIAQPGANIAQPGATLAQVPQFTPVPQIRTPTGRGVTTLGGNNLPAIPALTTMGK